MKWAEAEAKAVYGALVHAHARMYDAVKAAGDLDYLMNPVFLNAVARGDFDAGLNGSVVHLVRSLRAGDVFHLCSKGPKRRDRSSRRARARPRRDKHLR